MEGNQRGGAKDLASHLLKDNNDHVEVHEIRGFASDHLVSALNEVYGVSRGTKCKQFLYSLSINPPPKEKASTDDILAAIDRAEKALGLAGQPRAIVFHEKESEDGIVRRHAHAVWSRIDIVKMKAVQMSHDHRKLVALSRELYLEHEWRMPEGFADKTKRNPLNYTLAEWEKAQRQGKDPRAVKEALTDAWAISDSKASFEHALNERGYWLARGDRRGYVVTDLFGEVYSIPKELKKRTGVIADRLGDRNDLPSLNDVKDQLAPQIAATRKRHQEELKEEISIELQALKAERKALVERQRHERSDLKAKQKKRAEEEAIIRQSRFRKGLGGIWDRLRGEHARIRRFNEDEAQVARTRDTEKLEELKSNQMAERKLFASKAKVQLALERGRGLELDECSRDIAFLGHAFER